MPEGPEIRRAADDIAAVLVGKTIVAASFELPSIAQYAADVVGATVTAIDTRGKAMLTRFDNGLTLYSHNQLYGRWYTAPRGKPPATSRSLRVALHTETDSALLYSASDIEVLDAAGVAAHPFLNRIGPDILDPALTAPIIAARLTEDRFRKRTLGALFLDQSFLAGIGNYLRSEILFRAGLHPALRPADLDAQAQRRLARETLAVSRRSYKTKGVTVTAALVRRLRRGGDAYRRYRFWVFDRDGQACRECATTVDRMEVAGRKFFWCANCQPRTPMA